MKNDASFLYPSTSSFCVLSLSDTYEVSSEIALLPNPSIGNFSISSSINIKEFFISDILGNIILHEYVINKDKIKVNNLSAGTYFLTLIDVDNKIHKSKIISCP